MLIKAPLWLVFQTARVGSRCAFFPRGNFGAYNSAAQSCYAPSLPQGEYAVPEINVRQKSTDTFHVCTLALYHISLLLSTQYEHLFVYFNRIFCRYIIDICE